MITIRNNKLVCKMIVCTVNNVILMSYSILYKHYNDYNIYLDNGFALQYPAMNNVGESRTMARGIMAHKAIDIAE
jgi:hypothetical protein